MSPMIHTCNGDLLYTTIWGRSTFNLRKSAYHIECKFPSEQSEISQNATKVDITTEDPTGRYRNVLYKVSDRFKTFGKIGTYM